MTKEEAPTISIAGEALVIGPGELLVINAPRMDDQEVDNILTAVREAFDASGLGSNRVLVIAADSATITKVQP